MAATSQSGERAIEGRTSGRIETGEPVTLRVVAMQHDVTADVFARLPREEFAKTMS